MSLCIVNVGYTGSGKTTATKQLLNKCALPKFIYDVNNEYKEYAPSNISGIEFKKFLALSKDKKNTCIVFEEATIFFSHAGSSEDIKNLLVRKRHTNNLIILNFHALRQVPLYILDFTNYMNLLNTNDNPATIEKKFGDFPEIIDAYRDLQEENIKYNKKVIKFF